MKSVTTTEDATRKPGLRRIEAPRLDADGAWLRAAVETFEPRLREITGRGATAAWKAPTGGGCGWTCRCCRGVPLRRLDLDRWTIRHRTGSPAELARRLDRAKRRGETVILGARNDPWGGDTGHRGRTRSLLAGLDGIEALGGLQIGVLTASPLAICDLDLLASLDNRHSLTIELSLPTADPGLARALAPTSAPPREVLAAAGELAASGLTVQLRIRPLMPGVNDGDSQVARLLAAAAEAGVVDVAASPLTLPYGANRSRFLAWLAVDRPDLAAAYRRLYRFRVHLPGGERSALLEPFRRLHLAHGFPRPRPGRG